MYMFIYISKVFDKVGKWNVVVCCGTEVTQSPHYKTMEQKDWWFAKLLPIAIYICCLCIISIAITEATIMFILSTHVQGVK